MEGDVGDVGVPGRLELGQQVEDEAHLVGGEAQGAARAPSRVVVVVSDQCKPWKLVFHTGISFPDEESARLRLHGLDPPKVTNVSSRHYEYTGYTLGFGGQAEWCQIERVMKCRLWLKS